MMFLPAINYGDKTFSGLNVIFGYSESTKVLGATIEYFKFSFMNLLAYLFVIAVLVLGIMTILKENKLFTLLVVVLAIAGGIFLLLVKQFSIVGGVLFEAFYNATDDSVALAFGPIVASIFMFISAVLGAAKIVLGAKK